jgi:hypothetical protein
MAVKSKYFEAKQYYYKVLLICSLVVIDILFNSFTQFINFGVKADETSCKKDDFYLCIGLSLLQFILIIIMIFVLLNIFSQTFFFKRGLLGIICGKFIISFVFLMAYPIFFVLERIIFGYTIRDLEEQYKKKKGTLPIIEVWKGYYLLFYILKYLTAFGYYIGILRTSFELGKTEYYKNEPIKN